MNKEPQKGRAYLMMRYFFGTIGLTLMILTGGLGALYCVSTGLYRTIFMILSLVLLLAGISIYSYKEARKSEVFDKSKKSKDRKKKSGHKRHGKRCPQCQRLIYHRRTVCQHCGYEFPSHKSSTGSAPQPADKDNPR
jgi:flagellar biosynthesis component FlhA